MNGSLQASRTGVWLLKIAAVYLVIGIVMGLYMSITHQFQDRPVHVHVNLLGWASLGLAGMIYCFFSRAGNSRLGQVHFWLHNLGLPVMMLGLHFYLNGAAQWEPVIAAGSFITALGLVLFMANLFVNVRWSAAPAG